MGRNFNYSVQSVQFKFLPMKVSSYVKVGNFGIQLFIGLYLSMTVDQIKGGKHKYLASKARILHCS